MNEDILFENSIIIKYPCILYFEDTDTIIGRVTHVEIFPVTTQNNVVLENYKVDFNKTIMESLQLSGNLNRQRVVREIEGKMRWISNF